MARSVDKIRKKTAQVLAETAVAAVMGRKAPRVRKTSVKAMRRSKVAAPAAISFKSMAACMNEAILKCQEFKRAKKPKGQGVKRVKLTAEEKARRKEERTMVSEEKKQRAMAARIAKKASRVIINPGKYRKDKGYWTKTSRAERKAKWDGDTENRAARKQKRIDSYNKPENVARRAALASQNKRLDTVTGAVTG